MVRSEFIFPTVMSMTSSDLSETLTSASQLEQAAIMADRGGQVADAIRFYSQSIEKLTYGLSLCPHSHPDTVAIDRHISELQNRISYLSSLSATSRPLIPLESHISPVELTVAPPSPTGYSAKGSTMGAAAAIGGVGGLLLLGPLGLVAGAAGAAYASTRSDAVGSATRGVARGSVAVVDKVVDVEKQHHFTTKAMELGSAVYNKASEINQKYEVTDTVKTAGTAAFKRLATFNEQHGVTDKIASGVAAGISTLSNFLQPSSQPTPQPHQQYSQF